MKATYEHVDFGASCSVRVYNRRLPRIPFERHHHPEYELTLTMNSQGKRGNSHYHIALASTDESIAAIDVALAFEYIRNADVALDRLQHVRATLINILRKRR